MLSLQFQKTESPYANSGNNDVTIEDRWIRWVSEGHEPPAITVFTRVPSWKDIRAAHGELNLAMEESEVPNFWLGICLHNLARISREAATVRRVLEAIFRYFDNNNLWSPSKRLALCVLLDMQIVTVKSVALSVGLPLCRSWSQDLQLQSSLEDCCWFYLNNLLSQLMNIQIGESSRRTWLGEEADPQYSDRLLRAYSRPVEVAGDEQDSRWFISKDAIVPGLGLLGIKQGGPEAALSKPRRKRVVRKKVTSS